MGQEELKRALVREAEERIRGLWSGAEAEIAELRDALAERNHLADSESARKREKALATLRAESQQRSTEIRRRACLEAEARLLERLQGLARELLPALVAEQRGRWFAALAEELPDHAWQDVRVHPDDRQQAEKLFLKAVVKADDDIAGGLIVHGEAGRVRVDNSLAKRLERLWPELISRLIGRIREKEPFDDTVSPETGS